MKSSCLWQKHYKEKQWRERLVSGKDQLFPVSFLMVLKYSIIIMNRRG